MLLKLVDQQFNAVGFLQFVTVVICCKVLNFVINRLNDEGSHVSNRSTTAQAAVCLDIYCSSLPFCGVGFG